MTIGVSTDVKNSALIGIRALIDGGSAAGMIRVYTSPRPATGAAITSQTLLAEIDFNDPSFQDPVSGSMAMNLPLSTTGLAVGTAAWGRIVDSDSNFIIDIDVGDLLSSAELKLYTVAITIGGTINVVNGVISIS